MMLELLLILAAEPATQQAPAAPADAPSTATSGDLTVSQGGMMAWTADGKLGGQVMLLVDNAGSADDRIASVRTPAGTVGEISTYPVVNGRGTRAPDGVLSLHPGRTGVIAELTDIASGRPAPVETSITLVFETAGEVTIRAIPAAPAPPSPPPPPPQ
jgi:copper(I)-binding protein